MGMVAGLDASVQVKELWDRSSTGSPSIAFTSSTWISGSLFPFHVLPPDPQGPPFLLVKGSYIHLSKIIFFLN
eukprot:985486-Pelagomonas_calceolata.AAC.2